MSDELSEDRARALLARAAATVAVEERAPLRPAPPSRHRGAALLLGAAAAVVLVVGLVVLVDRARGGPAPTPAPAERRPVEQEHRYDDSRMPALLGADRDLAVAALEDRGLRVRVTELERGCWPADQVVRTSPAPGRPVTPGAEVRLQVTVPREVVDCVGEADSVRGTGLLRFARGWADVPALAPRVELSLDGGAPTEVAGEDLRTPDAPAWTLCADGTCHAAPALLRDLATRAPVDLGPGARLPGVRVGVAGQGCASGGFGTFVTVDRDADAAGCPLEAVWWDLDDRGRIAAVEMTTLPSAPVRAADPTRVRAAREFVRWARGDERAPLFAGRVRNMLGGGDHFGAPRWNEEPGRRDGWAGCSGLGFPDCGLDPVGAIARFTGEVTVAAGFAVCPGRGGVPTRYAAAPDDIVRLAPRGARCDGWLIELWIDARGRVYGVNLL